MDEIPNEESPKSKRLSNNAGSCCVQVIEVHSSPPQTFNVSIVHLLLLFGVLFQDAELQQRGRSTWEPYQSQELASLVKLGLPRHLTST